MRRSPEQGCPRHRNGGRRYVVDLTWLCRNHGCFMPSCLGLACLWRKLGLLMGVKDTRHTENFWQELKMMCGERACLRREKERGPVEDFNGAEQKGVGGTVTSCKIRQSRRSSLRYLIRILCQ